MKTGASLFSILIIDRDPDEQSVVERILRRATRRPFLVHQVECVNAAVAPLCSMDYDLVLLDDRSMMEWQTHFSLPMLKHCLPVLKAARGSADLAVMAICMERDYLETPDALGVDYVFDKADIIEFLQSVLLNAETDSQPPRITQTQCQTPAMDFNIYAVE